MIKGKKAAGDDVFKVLMEIVLVLVLIYLVANIFFTGFLSQLGEKIGLQVDRSAFDSDSDGIFDFEDKCRCVYGGFENTEYIGCPENYDAEQVTEANEMYNMDTDCGEVIFDDDGDGVANEPDKCPETPDQASVETTGPRIGCAQSQQVSVDTAAAGNNNQFIYYRSLGIYEDGSDTRELPPQNKFIDDACIGWMGEDCPSGSGRCDRRFFPDPLNEMCWVMAVENDPAQDDCGQARISEGTIIPVDSYVDLNVDLSNYYLQGLDEDPKELFTWRWRSKRQWGSLICAAGYWAGCNADSSGELVIDGTTYRCANSRWFERSDLYREG